MIEKIKAKGGLFFLSSGLVFTNLFTTLIIASSLGFGLALDVYYITLSVYLFLLASIGWSLTNVITPLLINNGVEKTISSIFYIVLTWSGGIAVGLLLLSPFLTKVIYSNYLTDYSQSFVTLVFLLACLTFVVDLLAQVFICFENASERFVRAIFINFISAVLGLALCYYFVESFGLIGALLTQLAIKVSLLTLLIALNVKWLQRYEYDRRIAKSLFLKSKYFFISGVYYRTEDLVEKFIASFLAPGLLSLVSFIQRIYSAVITVINTVIVTPTLTRFCKSETREQKYSDLKLIKLLCFLIVTGSLIFFPLFYFYGKDFLYLMFAEKLANVDDYVTVALTVLFPTFALLVINQLLHNFLLSRSYEKQIALFDMLSYSISLTVKIALTIYYGFIGLLLGVVITSLFKLLFKSYLFIKALKIENTSS